MSILVRRYLAILAATAVAIVTAHLIDWLFNGDHTLDGLLRHFGSLSAILAKQVFLVSIFAAIIHPWLGIMQARCRYSRLRSAIVLGALTGLSITFVRHILGQGWGLNLGDLMQFPAVGALGGYLFALMTRHDSGKGA